VGSKDSRISLPKGIILNYHILEIVTTVDEFLKVENTRGEKKNISFCLSRT
jgi:hypothetical protein